MVSVMSSFSIIARPPMRSHSGALRSGEPGIHNHGPGVWIPGSAFRPPRNDERERTASRPLRQELGELRADAGVELLAGAGLDREGVAPRPWLAGVDDDAGVARVVVAV